MYTIVQNLNSDSYALTKVAKDMYTLEIVEQNWFS